jgi:hypothetical protein
MLRKTSFATAISNSKASSISFRYPGVCGMGIFKWTATLETRYAKQLPISPLLVAGKCSVMKQGYRRKFFKKIFEPGCVQRVPVTHYRTFQLSAGV